MASVNRITLKDVNGSEYDDCELSVYDCHEYITISLSNERGDAVSCDITKSDFKRISDFINKLQK